MADLAHLQRMFADAILADKPEALDGTVEAVGALPVDRRLNIYRNNYRQGLSDSLAEIFPLVAAFVGTKFLKAALRRYIVTEPPQEPMLHRYGASFANFLDAFEPAQAVSYIADLARVEWAVHELQNVNEESLLAPEDVSQFLETGSLALSANVRLVKSEYPVVSLWMAGMGQLPPEAVHLGQGGQTAAVILAERQIRLLPLEGALEGLAVALQAGRDIAAVDPAVAIGLAERGLLAALENDGNLP